MIKLIKNNMDSFIQRETLRIRKRAAKHAADGVVAAIGNFMRKHLIVISATENNQHPLVSLAERLTAEWDQDPKVQSTYPSELDGSLKKAIEEAFHSDEMTRNLTALDFNKEDENFAKLCRVIAYGETLIFLDKNKFQIESLMDELRNGSKIIIPDKKLAT